MIVIVACGVISMCIVAAYLLSDMDMSPRERADARFAREQRRRANRCRSERRTSGPYVMRSTER